MSIDVSRTLNRLAKWRAHFAGWQLGTRLSGDPESEAVRDHREVSMIMRVELSAIAGLLIKKGVISQEELQAMLVLEAEQLEKAYERRWPGARATDEGMAYDVSQALVWMQRWKP